MAAATVDTLVPRWHVQRTQGSHEACPSENQHVESKRAAAALLWGVALIN